MGQGARILFVSHTAGWCGPVVSLLKLLRYLKEQYRPSVLLPERGDLCEHLADERVPFYVSRGLAKDAIPDVWRLVRREGFDLVYANNPHSSMRNVLIATKLARKPFIWHIRGMKWNWAWRTAGFLRLADAVVAVSHACAEPLRRYVRESKIHVVHNGVELATFDMDRTEARSHARTELGLGDQEVLIVSASHIMPRKGQAQAVAMMSQLPVNAKLILMGYLDRDPVYVADLRQQIEDLGLTSRVCLTGFRRDALQIMQGADIFIHTASSEPHPNAVLEGMAAGLPVVAFAADGVKETVAHGETGFLMDVGDVSRLAQYTAQLVDNSDLRTRMGQQGRRRVATHFTARHMAEKVTRVIEQAL